MTNTELLIEAVIYSQEEDIDWWDVFDSRTEALQIINKAMKEQPDEHQIANLMLYFEDCLDESLTIEKNYIYILRKLKKELREKQE